MSANGRRIALPAVRRDSKCSVEEALLRRRSVRSFAEREVSLKALGQLLWAAQGVTCVDGGRSAPSAGGLYPLAVYVVVGRVSGVAAGVYRYDGEQHSLRQVRRGDARAAVAAAAYDQDWIAESPSIVLIAADYGRTASRYGGKARRYVDVEAGHAAQGLCLQAVALTLGTTAVGAFDDAKLARATRLPTRQSPVLLLPFGHPA